MVLGSLITDILDNGLVLVRVAPSIQLIVKGAVIVVAVAFNREKRA